MQAFIQAPPGSTFSAFLRDCLVWQPSAVIRCDSLWLAVARCRTDLRWTWWYWLRYLPAERERYCAAGGIELGGNVISVAPASTCGENGFFWRSFVSPSFFFFFFYSAEVPQGPSQLHPKMAKLYQR